MVLVRRNLQQKVPGHHTENWKTNTAGRMDSAWKNEKDFVKHD